jgi:anti-sigma B factor antagonist
MRKNQIPHTTVSVLLPREIDFTNAEQVCAELCVHASAGADVIVADMTGTRFCDSAGLRMLLVVNDRLAGTASQFQVVIPADSPLMRALKFIGFDKILKIAPATTPAPTIPR